MGGGEHGHEHHEPFKVPDYKIYSNYRSFPELLKHEQRLAQMGLKDPWIRNYVWMFDKRNLFGLELYKKTILAGFWPGLAYAGTLIVVTSLYSSYKKSRGGGHGHGHDEKDGGGHKGHDEKHGGHH